MLFIPTHWSTVVKKVERGDNQTIITHKKLHIYKQIAAQKKDKGSSIFTHKALKTTYACKRWIYAEKEPYLTPPSLKCATLKCFLSCSKQQHEMENSLWGILVLPAAGGFSCPYYSDGEVSTTCVKQDTSR